MHPKLIFKLSQTFPEWKCIEWLKSMTQQKNFVPG